jgi:hypothetical protein
MWPLRDMAYIFDIIYFCKEIIFRSDFGSQELQRAE